MRGGGINYVLHTRNKLAGGDSDRGRGDGDGIAGRYGCNRGAIGDADHQGRGPGGGGRAAQHAGRVQAHAGGQPGGHAPDVGRRSASSAVMENVLCTAPMEAGVGVSVAVTAGTGLIISGKICDACSFGVELSVTVIVEPGVRSPIPVTYKLMVDPLGAGLLVELME